MLNDFDVATKKTILKNICNFFLLVSVKSADHVATFILHKIRCTQRMRE